jgi:glycosyltransferase involved in cell wall biosynthesis
MGYKIGIDASRNRSGGAVIHVTSIIKNLHVINYNISEVHLWAPRIILDDIPDAPWLFKHCPVAIEKSLFRQLYWQAITLKFELNKYGCSILFSTDAATLSQFNPLVVLGQDLLAYELSDSNKFKFSYEYLRLRAIFKVQNYAFVRARGVIFLTDHASKVIQKFTGKLPRVSIIPHGVSDLFRVGCVQNKILNRNSHISCVYVSPILDYKNHIEVIKAIKELREIGIDIRITFIGDDKLFNRESIFRDLGIDDYPANIFKFVGSIKPILVLEYLKKSDIFIFASSSESFGISLLEGMAMGMKIACSNKSSLPELLQDGGVYFDPKDYQSISTAILNIIDNEELQLTIGSKAKALSNAYSWRECSIKTFSFIVSSLN